MHIYIYICKKKNTLYNMHICIKTNDKIYEDLSAYTNVYLHLCTSMYMVETIPLCMFKQVYIYMYIYICIYIYIHKSVHKIQMQNHYLNEKTETHMP